MNNVKAVSMQSWPQRGRQGPAWALNSPVSGDPFGTGAMHDDDLIMASNLNRVQRMVGGAGRNLWRPSRVDSTARQSRRPMFSSLWIKVRVDGSSTVSFEGLRLRRNDSSFHSRMPGERPSGLEATS